MSIRLIAGNGRVIRSIALAVLILAVSGAFAESAPPVPGEQPQTFDVAEIQQVEPGDKAPRFIVMQGPHRFVVKDYTLTLLVAAAYDLNPRTISGGPAWAGSDHYDITAIAPGEVSPSRDAQMAMLRRLLSDRFHLVFHREQKEFSIYELKTASGGAKLTPSTALADQPPALISVVHPGNIVLPARNATMGEFVSVLQRAILDRPVVDKTGLSRRFSGC
ncbi:MAG TPA: TIGR03435 family protein, partial [Acidobacteriaceae bacterium]|nr:TIGR03435 family protein [Acidobacteriaceae bacterium]